MNYVISPGREFADSAEFKTRGTRSQIPENLGHVPEFGANCEFSSRGNEAIYELFRLNTYEGLILVIFYRLTQFRGINRSVGPFLP
jgi:hypothetical protein